MSNNNDFPLVEAPAAGRKGVFSIAMVLFSFTFFTGTMFAGGKLGVSFSIVNLLWIAVIGNALLALYAASLGWIAARSGLNTVLMGRFCFGEIGSKLADFILGFAELGWYAWGTATVAISLVKILALPEALTQPLMVLFGILFCVTALVGYRGLDALSRLSVPLMFVLLMVSMYLALHHAGGWQAMTRIAPSDTMTWSAAITMVFGTFASGATQATNWTRLANSSRTAILASMGSFLIGNGLMIVAGAWCAIVYQQADIVEVLILQGLLAVKQEAADLIDLQIVAFPQEGIESYPNGRELMTRAIEMGADVVGGIPHYENTRDKGVSSVMFLMDLAQRYGRLVDVHCDEIDDPQSRFLEVLAEEARVRGMGAQVTASHTCAMGSYDNAYCSKLFRLLKASGINFISCPTESIHLQGRFDSWPKRRGVTRVAELDRAGINVCFAQDSIQDPWYPLGNGNILRILDAGLHICHMLGYDDLQRCLDFVTDNSARALCLGDNYGLAEGRPANLLILDAENDYEAVRRQARVLTSIRHGRVILQREVEHIRYPA
ncbi:cytosine permease [Klebsiella pneumoniae]